MRRRSFTDVETLTGDLRAFVIGVIAGVISGVVAFYLTKVIDRYWALRSIKSLRRRMEYAEAQKARLDELMKSDRALLLMAFRALFGLLGIIAVALTGQELLLFVRERFTISPEQLVSFHGMVCRCGSGLLLCASIQAGCRIFYVRRKDR
jgi:hypothetical protein